MRAEFQYPAGEGRTVMLGLAILVAICFAGIAFMGMFLGALARDVRPRGADQLKPERGTVVEMPEPGKLSPSSAGGKRKWGR